MPTSTESSNESSKNQWLHLKDWGSPQTATTSGVAGLVSEEDSSKNQTDLFHTLYGAIDSCETPADVISCIRQIETNLKVPFATHNPKMSGLKFFGFPNQVFSAEHNVLIKQAKNQILDMLLNNVNLTIDDDIKNFLARHRSPFSSGRTKSSKILEQIQRDRGDIGGQNIFSILAEDTDDDSFSDDTDDDSFSDDTDDDSFSDDTVTNIVCNIDDIYVVNLPMGGGALEEPTEFRMNVDFFKRAKAMLAKEKQRLKGWVSLIVGSEGANSEKPVLNKNSIANDNLMEIGKAACAGPSAQ